MRRNTLRKCCGRSHDKATRYKVRAKIAEKPFVEKTDRHIVSRSKARPPMEPRQGHQPGAHPRATQAPHRARIVITCQPQVENGLGLQIPRVRRGGGLWHAGRSQITDRDQRQDPGRRPRKPRLVAARMKDQRSPAVNMANPRAGVTRRAHAALNSFKLLTQ